MPLLRRVLATVVATFTVLGGLVALDLGPAVAGAATPHNVTSLAATFSPSLTCGSLWGSSATAPIGTTQATFTVSGGGGAGGDTNNGTDGGDGGDGAEVTGTISITGTPTLWATAACGGSGTGTGGAGYSGGGTTTNASGGGGGGSSALCLGTSTAGCGGGAVQAIAGGGGGGGAASAPTTIGISCSDKTGGGGGNGNGGTASSGGASGENSGAGQGGGAGADGDGGDPGHDGGGGAGGTGTAPGQGGSTPGNDQGGGGGDGANDTANGSSGGNGPDAAPTLTAGSGSGGASDDQNGYAGGGGGGGLAGGGGGGSGAQDLTFTCLDGTWDGAGGGGAGSSWSLASVTGAAFVTNSSTDSSCAATDVGTNPGVGAGTGGGDGCAGDVAVDWIGAAPLTPTPAAANFILNDAGSVTFASADTVSYAETGALPSGLSFDTTTGVLSGTPSGPVGSYPIAVTATNAYGTSPADDVSVNVGNPTTTVASVSPDSVTTGDTVTYSATVSSPDGTPTGEVDFSTSAGVLCVDELTSGLASCTATDAPVGVDTVTAAYQGSSDFHPSSGTATLTVIAAPGPYTPLPPVRICDTRAGNPSGLSGEQGQCNGRSLTPLAPLNVVVGGQFGVPADATAAVLNVTAVDPLTKGYMTVYPTGGTAPTASNLNFPASGVVANLVETGIGDGGDVSVIANQSTDVVVDLEGYVTNASAEGAGLYVPLANPARICDTRPGNPSGLTGGATQCNGSANVGSTLKAGTALAVKVEGEGGVPASGVGAAVLNVTGVSSSTRGYITAYPAGESAPTASNLNFTPGHNVPNRVIVPVPASGQIDLISNVSVNAIVDVTGWFTTPGSTPGSLLTPEPTPVRICDTRAGNPSGLSGGAAQCNGTAGAGKPLGTHGTLSVTVTGLANVPATAKAVILNVTAVSPSAQTYLTVFPGASPPTVSDLNPAPGEVEANLVVATVSANGTVNIYNYAGSVNVVVDVMGWFAPST